MLGLNIDTRVVELRLKVDKVDVGSERTKCIVSAYLLDTRTGRRVVSSGADWTLYIGEETGYTITFRPVSGDEV